MMRSRRSTLAALGLGLVSITAAACGGTPLGGGGDGDGRFPQRPITWIVPYDPGGGSDQQARRLQPHLEEILGQQINVVYKTGGDGAVGWQQLVAAKPDGYTVGNVVLPNILVLSETGDIDFAAQDLEYITWTETTPNALAVAKNSPFASLDDFVAAAKRDPGKVTVAGVGDEGEALVGQVSEAAGIDVTLVPVSGGVGGMIPQLQGGHVDAAFFGASHVLEHPDTLRALAISGTEPSPALSGVPTFESEGYEGILISTSWGIAAPPGTPRNVVKTLNEAINEAVTKVEADMKKDALTPLHQTPAEAETYVEDQLGAVQDLVG